MTNRTLYLFFISFFWLSTTAQELNQFSSELTKVDSLMLSTWPPLPVPEQYLGPNPPLIPPVLNNADLPHFPPIFSQDGWSCGQSAGIGYNFTYETNASRNLPADTLDNRYAPLYTWNFFNDGRHDLGVSYYHSFELVKKSGHPNMTDFGLGINYLSWMDGYDKYYRAMHNKIENIYSIFVGNVEGVTVLKHWMNDHLNGSEVGGIASFYSELFSGLYLLPQGTPEEGKHVITEWGAYLGHAMTLVGYNDSIRFDYNNDGQYTNHIDIDNDGAVTLSDWEIGGFILANSHGLYWADSGFCYVMYKSLADKKPNGGTWNQSVQVLDIKEDYSPLLTIKFKITHTSRDKLKIFAGVSNPLLPDIPEHIIEFDHFNYNGGTNFMLGDTSENSKTMEAGLDITPLLSYIESDLPATIFLGITEDDPEMLGQGIINQFSLIDYTIGVNEINCLQSDIPILHNNTTILSIDHTLDFNKIVISTDELPPCLPGESYSAQIEAVNGFQPLTWEINEDYLVNIATKDYPAISGDKIIHGNSENIRVPVNLGFFFPFGGTEHSQV
ncbi:MAG: hypothetical protein K8R53_14730, partial [Bacteroidales bacterium]|nr:hypothetical protein [Bacteroidales bacterium]